MPAEISNSDAAASFMQLFSRNARRVYSFILTLLLDRNDAEDVFQETCLVLWKKHEQFQPETDFHAWACKIAYYEVLKYRKQRASHRRMFSEEFCEAIERAAAENAAELELRRRALASCLEKLPDPDRQMLDARYSEKGSTKGVAERLGRSLHSVYRRINRIHEELLHCIQKIIVSENNDA